LAQVVFDITLTKGADAGRKLFHAQKDAPNYYFREDEMNNAGYALLQAGKPSDAIEIFKLNVLSFPNSWNAYDSLAEAYLRAGDKKRAVENYSRSLKLNPRNKAAAEFLEKNDK